MRGAYLYVDMAHYSGLVAGKVVKDPFEFADIVVTTTHKSLRSTRASMIFYKKEYASMINNAVFPGCQGGPHNHAIAGIAVQLKEVATPEFQKYAQEVVANCKRLAERLQTYNYKIVTGGTDTHLILWDLRPEGISGSRVSAVCDEVAITLNKNTVHGDKSAMKPGGVRIGTPAMTTRGMVLSDFDKVGDFLHETCQLALKIQSSMDPAMKKLKDFREAMHNGFAEEVRDLKSRVVDFSKGFYMPGRFMD